jgi:uncharacterized protein (AIM24 family)
MADRNPSAPVTSRFDHGVFLLHYNRGREAFQEGRFAEARRELESAQKLRPDDADVLNLLGLVYFKTNSFPEAEVIYRRLTSDNPNVFILHSNLGLTLFKQGKLDDAEKFLQRAIELRPNYAKSHLYLGLLHRQRKAFPLALEHLKFAGADRLAREVEKEMQPRPDPSTLSTQKIKVAPAAALPTQPGTAANPIAAASKLQEAVDESARTAQGASKTFALHENGFLEINLSRNVHVKKGTVSSYSGNLKFEAESGLLGTTAQLLVKAAGQGKIFVFEKGRKTFLLDLNEEFIYVEGSNLLALEDTLTYRVEPIYDSSYQRKLDTVKIFGRGSVAISTTIEPLTLRVTKDYPLSISSLSLVAWTGNLIPTVVDDKTIDAVMIESSSDGGFQIRFEGDGVVISER